jgi:hypothetical protein
MPEDSRWDLMRLFSLLLSHREIDGALLFLLAMGSVALIVATPTLKGEEMRAMICAVLMMSLVGCERYCPTVMTHEGEDVRVEYIDGVAYHYQARVYEEVVSCTWLRQDDECGWVETDAPDGLHADSEDGGDYIYHGAHHHQDRAESYADGDGRRFLVTLRPWLRGDGECEWRDWTEELLTE